MFIRCTVLAVIVFFGSLTVAKAQPVPQTPDSGSQVINGVGIRKNAANTSGRDATTRATLLGWNFIRVDRCWMVLDRSTTWLYIFAQGDSEDYYYTNSFSFQNMLAPACQNQNVIGFFVADQRGL